MKEQRKKVEKKEVQNKERNAGSAEKRREVKEQRKKVEKREADTSRRSVQRNRHRSPQIQCRQM